MDRKSFLARLIAVPTALLGIKLSGSGGEMVTPKEVLAPTVEEYLFMYGEANIKMPDMNPNLLRKYPRTFAESYFKDSKGNIWRGIEQTADRFVLNDDLRKILGE